MVLDLNRGSVVNEVAYRHLVRKYKGGKISAEQYVEEFIKLNQMESKQTQSRIQRVLDTPFYRLPWYHKLWLGVPFYATKLLNRLLLWIIEKQRFN